MRIANRQSERAFTGTDLLIVIVTLGVILVFAVLCLPASHSNAKGPRVRCFGGLKYIALAFELWSQDNGARLGSNSYPMGVLESAGGTKESIENGRIVDSFMAISNQLRIPQGLACPADKATKRATSFAKLTTRNISYFLAADANETNANQILAGDRDAAVNGKQAASGVLRVTDPLAISWAGVIHGPSAGNIALADGSAHQVTSKGLRDLLQCAGSVTNNRLLVP